MTTVGLVLAAGAGSRMGEPKALVRDEQGPWLVRAVDTLLEGGCDTAYVVLGAAVVGPRELLREERLDEVRVVVAEDWAEGQSASLKAGLASIEATDATACLVTLVDLPDVGPPVVARLLEGPVDDHVLARASYHGTPGHPVLIGRHYWPQIRFEVHGDSGARQFLVEHDVTLVDCGDLATGADRDSR